MVWKEGDKIEFFKNGVRDSIDGQGFTIGKRYEILALQIRFGIDDIYSPHGMQYAVSNDNGRRLWIEVGCFRKRKKRKKKGEVGMLDNIQENFRDGF